MAAEVFVVQLFYWTGSRHMQGAHTTFEAAKTAMLIGMPYATKLETHRIIGDQELWYFTDGLAPITNGATIERVPLSGVRDVVLAQVLPVAWLHIRGQVP